MIPVNFEKIAVGDTPVGFTVTNYAPTTGDYHSHKAIAARVDCEDNNIFFMETPPVAVADEAVGTGNDSDKTFDLDHFGVVPDTLTVFVNDVETDVTLSAGTGTLGVDQIVFDDAPVQDAVITADYRYLATGHLMKKDTFIMLESAEAIENFKAIEAVAGQAANITVTFYFAPMIQPAYPIVPPNTWTPAGLAEGLAGTLT
jgi:hypothetical protein